MYKFYIMCAFQTHPSVCMVVLRTRKDKRCQVMTIVIRVTVYQAQFPVLRISVQVSFFTNNKINTIEH